MNNFFLFFSIRHWLVILSILINLIGVSAYIRDTLKGKSKPNRVTWFMWAFAPLVGTVAALSAGADPWATSRIFLAGFTPLLVFLISFANSKSYWKLTTFDLLCGICSVVAFGIWAFMDNSKLAILLAATGDMFATLPTLKKAWIYPETETGLTFLAGFISVWLIVPSIPKWDIENSAFQIYLITANTFLIFVIYRKQIKNLFVNSFS